MVPGTNHLANIASKEPIGLFFHELDRDIAAVFYVVISDATTRVNGSVWQDTGSWASLDAFLAGAAAISVERRIRG